MRKLGRTVRTLNIDFWMSETIPKGIQQCRFLTSILMPDRLQVLELMTLPPYISKQCHLFPQSGKKYLPHVKYLTLNCGGEFSSTFIKDLLFSTPQLYHLKILFLHEEVMDYITTGILETGIQNLAHIDFQCSDESGFTTTHANRLVMAGLPLQTLRFHTVDIMPHYDCLKILLTNYSQGLRKIRLYPSTGCSDLDILPNVLEVTLECPWISDIVIFMKKCPNMTSLTTTGDYYVNIQYWDVTANDTNFELLNSSIGQNEELKHECLKTLAIQDRTYDARIYYRLLNFFPNLTKLSAHVDDKVFGLICSMGSQLKELDIVLYSLVPNAVLIGAIPHAEESGSVDSLKSTVKNVNISKS